MGQAQAPGQGTPDSQVGPVFCSVAFTQFLVPGQGGQGHMGGLVDTEVPGTGSVGARSMNQLQLWLCCPMTISAAWTDAEY